MSSWNKKNKLRMKVTYSMDKYKEGVDYGETLETIEGDMAYVNMPFANSFLNLNIGDNNIISIAYPLVLKIEWVHMPKWTQLTEKQVVDSAKMRLLNLNNELEIQRNTFDQEQRMKDATQGHG